jgi:hypothetical protein
MQVRTPISLHITSNVRENQFIAQIYYVHTSLPARKHSPDSRWPSGMSIRALTPFTACTSTSGEDRPNHARFVYEAPSASPPVRARGSRAQLQQRVSTSSRGRGGSRELTGALTADDDRSQRGGGMS